MPLFQVRTGTKDAGNCGAEDQRARRKVLARCNRGECFGEGGEELSRD
jgi:hypothetical protein